MKIIMMLSYAFDYLLTGIAHSFLMLYLGTRQIRRMQRPVHRNLKAVVFVAFLAVMAREVILFVGAGDDPVPAKSDITKMAYAFPETPGLSREERTYTATVVVWSEGRTVVDHTIVWFFQDNAWHAELYKGTEPLFSSMYVTEEELLEDIRKRYPRLPVDDLVSR